jgi:hypothetical protein
MSLALAFGGCVAQRDDSQSDPAVGSGSSTPFLAEWSALGTEGFVYLQVNTGGKHYEIFRVELATLAITQITDVPGPFGISQFSVSSAGLVVAEASTLVDRLATVGPDGQLIRLPRAGASGPVINDRGDILAYRPTRNGDDLVLRRAGSDRWVRLLSDLTAWTVSAWMNDTTVAVFRPQERETSWSRLTLDGHQSPARRLAAGPLFPSDYGSHPLTWTILQTGAQGRARSWTAGHEPTPLPRGWSQGCVSPDGRSALLLGRNGLGLTRADGAVNAVEVIGESNAEILGCGWVGEKYGP